MAKKKSSELDEYDEDYSQQEVQVQPFPLRKIVTGAIVALVIIIVIVLLFNLLSQSNNPLIRGPNGELIKSNVTISTNGQVIDSFSTDGNTLSFSGNPQQTIKGKITTNIATTGKKTTKIIIKKSDGSSITVKTNPEDVYLDENGVLHFSVNPIADFGLEGYYDENTGEFVFNENETLGLTFEFVITDEETKEDTIIDIPVNYSFVEFTTTGCIGLNRNFVSETTHYGTLELNSKMQILCDSSSDLTASVEWNGEQAGNVEVSFDNYKSALVLSSYERRAMITPTEGEYELKIVFTPFKEFAGKKSSFKVNFSQGPTKTAIEFDTAIDNLEQCVKVSPDNLTIPSNSDSTTFKIDVSECYSPSVNFALCSNNENCAGGSEGGVSLSENTFSLSPKGNSSKTITVSRKNISGAYGIPIQAKVYGADTVLIDEKLLIVQPKPQENIIPDKFVVSLLGGARDSIRVKNNTLAEDVEINSSICSLYKSSQGIKGDTSVGAGVTAYAGLGSSWWRDLATNYDRYSGSGKYQAALVNTLSAMDNIRRTTQLASREKNTQIKQAYLYGPDLLRSSNSASKSAQDTLDLATDLKSTSDEYNKFKNADVGIAYTKFAMSAASFATSATVNCGLSTTAASATSTYAGVAASCPAALPAATAASTSEATAVGIGCGTLVVGATGIYQSVQAMATPLPDISPGAAHQFNKEVVDLTVQINKSTLKVKEYLDLALQFASIDSFSNASTNDAKAMEYLELAKTENKKVLELTTTAKEKILSADNELTTLIQQEQSDLATAAAYAGMGLEAITLLDGCTTGLLSVETSATNAETSLGLSGSAAVASCNIYTPGCCATVTAVTPAGAAVANQLSALAATSPVLLGMGAASIGMTGYETIRSTKLPEIAKKTSETRNANSNTVQKINELYLNAAGLDSIIDAAIDSANWLTDQEKKGSDASTYTNESIVNLEGSFNKKRLIGVVGSAIIGGFVSGAYEGGVYSSKKVLASNIASPLRSASAVKEKKILFADELAQDFVADPVTDLSASSSVSEENNSDLLEDCENKVRLTLPDYIINLVHDGKQINVTNSSVIANWDFSDSQVFDVFESQEVGVIFGSNGLRTNSYGIVEFNVEKHVHASPTEPNSTFGPFNIPDSGVEQVVVKYHFKFNSEPRTGNNFVSFKNNDCSNGLFLGKTGSTNLPKVILSWDWNSVRGIGNFSGSSDSYRTLRSASVGAGTSEEPYLDASQLAILLSKKIGALSNFLDSVSPTCPLNPAKQILEVVRPNITDPSTNQIYSGEDLDQQETCYLPLTTKTYDGKPALYYFVEDKPLTLMEEWFSDTQRLNNAEELTNLIDFNVNLMRDGYGSDFQYDFTNSYSRTMLKAGPSFLDPSSGAKKYLQDTDFAYFSSQANFLKMNQKWTLPDAGKYRVRLLVDFRGLPKLFNGSAPSAKIIADIYLVEPVNNNYSPLYYTPIDGFVGLNASNNRRSYGSSATQEFSIAKNEGVILDPDQKEALVRISASKNNNFFLLNSIPSLRSKILDFTFNFNSRTGVDSNSKIFFTPTVATPLLFELWGITGTQTDFFYTIKKDNQIIDSDLSNLFLLSSVGDCSDLAGKLLSNYFKKAPDNKNGKTYGVLLPAAITQGVTFLKTVAYSPITDSYGLVKPAIGKVYSSNDLAGMNNPISLNGISTMVSNDAQANSVVDSLYNTLNGINSRNICVTSLGNREIFWWPEDTLFNKTGAEGSSISTKENEASALCNKVS